MNVFLTYFFFHEKRFHTRGVEPSSPGLSCFSVPCWLPSHHVCCAEASGQCAARTKRIRSARRLFGAVRQPLPSRSFAWTVPDSSYWLLFTCLVSAYNGCFCYAICSSCPLFTASGHPPTSSGIALLLPLPVSVGKRAGQWLFPCHGSRCRPAARTCSCGH